MLLGSNALARRSRGVPEVRLRARVAARASPRMVAVQRMPPEFHHNDINDIPIFKALSGKVDRCREGDF